MNNIGFNCDVCGRTVDGITYVNGMKFCAKCYQETFGNKENYITLEYKPYVDNTLHYKLLDTKDMKVKIWGKELTSVAEWEDFLKIGEELEQENKILKEALKLACKMIVPDCIDRNITVKIKDKYYNRTDLERHLIEQAKESMK